MQVDRASRQSPIPPRPRVARPAPIAPGLGLLGALLAAGCAEPRVDHRIDRLVSGIPQSVMQVPVVPLFTPATQGTAVVLGPNALLTCAHVLDPGGGRVHANGAWRDVEIRGRGRGSAWSDDWVLFALAGDGSLSDRRPCHRDFGRELPAGVEVYLLGHRGESVELTTILSGFVVEPPDLWNMPDGVSYLAVDMVPERTDDGMSGAAAVIVDEETGRPVIIGMLVGRATVTVNGMTAGYLRVIARPELPRVPPPPPDD